MVDDEVFVGVKDLNGLGSESGSFQYESDVIRRDKKNSGRQRIYFVGVVGRRKIN